MPANYKAYIGRVKGVGLDGKRSQPGQKISANNVCRKFRQNISVQASTPTRLDYI